MKEIGMAIMSSPALYYDQIVCLCGQHLLLNVPGCPSVCFQVEGDSWSKSLTCAV